MLIYKNDLVNPTKSLLKERSLGITSSASQATLLKKFSKGADSDIGWEDLARSMGVGDDVNGTGRIAGLKDGIRDEFILEKNNLPKELEKKYKKAAFLDFGSKDKDRLKIKEMKEFIKLLKDSRPDNNIKTLYDMTERRIKAKLSDYGIRDLDDFDRALDVCQESKDIRRDFNDDSIEKFGNLYVRYMDQKDIVLGKYEHGDNKQIDLKKVNELAYNVLSFGLFLMIDEYQISTTTMAGSDEIDVIKRQRLADIFKTTEFYLKAENEFDDTLGIFNGANKFDLYGISNESLIDCILDEDILDKSTYIINKIREGIRIDSMSSEEQLDRADFINIKEVTRVDIRGSSPAEIRINNKVIYTGAAIPWKVFWKKVFDDIGIVKNPNLKSYLDNNRFFCEQVDTNNKQVNHIEVEGNCIKTNFAQEQYCSRLAKAIENSGTNAEIEIKLIPHMAGSSKR